MWPELSEIPAVSGRAARKEDVASGRAVFVLESEGQPIGLPIDIKLPQYAYHVDVDTGERTPGVLIQAEEAGGQQIAGFVAIPSGNCMAATLAEFELLGSDTPQ